MSIALTFATKKLIHSIHAKEDTHRLKNEFLFENSRMSSLSLTAPYLNFSITYIKQR